MNDRDDDTAEARADQENDALLSRLRLIEDQPLDSRAEAYGHVHEQLQSELEGGDAHHR
jgi:hypothetical protein